MNGVHVNGQAYQLSLAINEDKISGLHPNILVDLSTPPIFALCQVKTSSFSNFCINPDNISYFRIDVPVNFKQ